MPLSGKSTVSKHLEKKGFIVLDMGDIVRIEMDKRDIKEGNEGEFTKKLRKIHGKDAIAELCAPYLEEMKEEKEDILITGIRSLEEKNTFEKKIGNGIKIIAVWASRKTRKERKEKRKREEDIMGDEFKERDEREINYGLAKIITLSDHLVKNENKSKKELKQEVFSIVR